MTQHVPNNPQFEAEKTLSLAESIRPVEPAPDLLARIMAKFQEARQPGYFPFLSSLAGESIRKGKQTELPARLVFAEQPTRISPKRDWWN